MTDKALILMVTGAQRGDARAFDALVRRFQNTAVAYARTLLPDPAAAEDAAQEAFVQAWRDLPRLAEPAAFGAWLRRIVFKFCDRARRSSRLTLPLDDTMPLPSNQSPASVLERADEAAQVRAAIDALPCALREVTLLYYLTGHDIKEIAAFLALPSSTVKNRLHAARKRLRKELWIMAETILDQEKPSQAHTETFAETVLARVLREFQQQKEADPRTVKRGLLDEGRTALFQILSDTTPLDEQSLRNGFMVLWHKQDWQSLSTLLMRYLKLPLNASETAWAYLHLANTIAMSGSAAGAVLAYETFERWIPGKSLTLSAQWPFYPVNKDSADACYAGDEVHLLFLAQLLGFPVSYWNRNAPYDNESLEFRKSFAKAWYNSDYLAKVDAVLSEIPCTQRNHRLRFLVLQKAANACVSIGNLDSTERYVQQMHVVAGQSEDISVKAELIAQALGQGIHLAQRKQDNTAFTKGVEEMMALLNEAAAKGGGDAQWIRGQRQALAIVLMRGNRHNLALSLWEANAKTGGQLGGYGRLMYAATLWQTTHDRETTLALLREARVYDDRDMTPSFIERPEFADVREDPEFLQAIGQTGLDPVTPAAC